jgi:ATP-binding cassette subfamily B protein
MIARKLSLFGTPNTSAIVRLMGLAWRYRARVIGLLVLQFILMGLSILALQLSGFAIDWIIYRKSGAQSPPLIYKWHPMFRDHVWQEILVIAAIIAIVALVRAILNHFYSISNGKFINQEMVVDLRIGTFQKLQLLDFEYYNRNDTSSLINRLTGDVQLTRSFVDGVIVQIIVLGMSLIFYLAAMLQLHVGLTVATLCSVPLMVWQTYSFSKRIRPQYDRNRQLFDDMMLTVQENIEGQVAVKAFGKQAAEVEKFRAATHRVEAQQRSIFWKVSTYTPTVQFLTQLNLVILLLYGGYLVSINQLQLGSGLVVFAGLLQQFSNQVTTLTGITNTIEQSLAGARRVFEVVDTPIGINQSLINDTVPHASDSIGTPTGAVNRNTASAGHFELENVCFEFRRGSPTLSDLSFAIEPKSKVAIVGPVGCGKSTLLQLLPRFYDPSGGTVRLDGKTLPQYDLVHLRRSIGFVFQEPFIFSNSIAANIAYGNPLASLDDIQRAAEMAAIHPFIQSQPDGYATILGESGLTLSGGQRQRLALARALLLNPPILVLDDPTSAVDVQTEHEIWAALSRAFEDRTSILASNRAGILSRVDKIIFMQQGKVTTIGSHQELMSTCDAYAELMAQESSIIG